MSYKQASDAGLLNDINAININATTINTQTINVPTVNSLTVNSETLNTHLINGNVETGLTLTTPALSLSIGSSTGDNGQVLTSNGTNSYWGTLPAPITSNITSQEFEINASYDIQPLPTDWNSMLIIVAISQCQSTPVASFSGFLFTVAVNYSDSSIKINSAPFNFYNPTTGWGTISLLIYPLNNGAIKPVSINTFIVTTAGQTISKFNYKIDKIRLS